MADNPHLAHLKEQRRQCEAMLASLENGELLSGVNPDYHKARINFTRNHIADLNKAILIEEAEF